MTIGRVLMKKQSFYTSCLGNTKWWICADEGLTFRYSDPDLYTVAVVIAFACCHSCTGQLRNNMEDGGCECCITRAG